jgi:hypothetical protein
MFTFHGISVVWLVLGFIVLIVVGVCAFFVGRFIFRLVFKKKDVVLSPAEDSFLAVAETDNMKDAAQNLKTVSTRLKKSVENLNAAAAGQEKYVQKIAKQKKRKAKESGWWKKWWWVVLPTAAVLTFTLLKVCGLSQ